MIHPEGGDFTFHRPNCAASRLDRFYVPLNLLKNVKAVSHQATLGDHHYVCLSLSLEDFEIGPPPQKPISPYWKLNTSILKDEDFLENFSLYYSKLQIKIPDFADIADWWDLCAKPNIKNFCIGVSSHLADVRKDTKKYLFSYLTLVMRQGNWEEIARVRQQLKEIMQKESRGFVIRSKFKENAESEQASLFHANRENKNFVKNNHGILKINDDICDNQKKIEDEILKYFGALFNGHHDRDLFDTGTPFVPDNTHLDEFLSDLGKLSPESQAKVEKDLTYEEVENIIKNECDYNKSPGLDGLPYEFYRETWNVIGQDFTQVLQVELERFNLIESDKVGATRLAPKVDGVPSVSELRPITLLNSDYKILRKCFVDELAPVMGEIILSGQLCSVKEKNILCGVSNIMSSVDYVNAHNVPAFIGTFDMFKAYDRVLLDYLVRVMKAMKFPDKYIGWILMLHDG